jgi:regulator of sigma E protease
MVDSLIGISPEYSFSFGKSIAYGFIGIKNSAMMIKDTLSLLFGSSQVGVSDLAGPIGIYQITNNALKQGFVSLLGWIGLLSVNLGVINLLPIPALDGGRLVFLGAEAVGDKVGFKISTKFENRLHYLMYLLLLGLFVFITYNDILRLIKSIF